MALTQDIANFVDRRIGYALSRLANLARMVSLSGAGLSGGRVTSNVPVSKLETHQSVEVLLPYGITAVPPAGDRGLLLCLGGDGAHPVALSASSPSTRLAGVGSGEIAIHVGTSETGARLVCRTNGTIEINPGPLAVVSVVPNDAVAAPLPVARTGDSVAVASSALLTLKDAIDAWVPVANDGGAALKTALATFLGLDDAAVQAGTGTITGGGTGMVST